MAWWPPIGLNALCMCGERQSTNARYGRTCFLQFARDCLLPIIVTMAGSYRQELLGRDVCDTLWVVGGGLALSCPF